MTLDEFLSLVKIAKVTWKIDRNGSIKPCPLDWLANNLGAKGSNKFERGKSLGLSTSSSWALTEAIIDPNTSHVILRMELEQLCKSNLKK